jgi:hypothetical protein
MTVVAVAVGVATGDPVDVALAVGVAVAVAVAVRVVVAVAVAVGVLVAVRVGVAVAVAVGVRVAVSVVVAVAVLVAVRVGVRVAVAVIVGAAVCVAVAVRVAVAVALAVALRVAVAVAVAVRVAVAVLVAVAVGVAVRVEVGVGVGLFFFFFAEPVALTLVDDVPLVASLVIAIFAEKSVPVSVGANSTVTVDSPCGSISVAPWPDTMWKNSLPAAGATVTDRAAPPLSLMTKDLLSVAAPFDRLSLPKSSVVGVTSSLLTDASRRASSTESCARALNENENKTSNAETNDAIDAARAMREDASNELPRPIVKRSPEML